MSASNVIFKDCVCIGAGISGIALSRWLKEYDFDFVVLEKSDDVGGLWRYRQDDYGVMDFTCINVSKYNYCFSDYPFPKETAEFMHHTDIHKYAKSYVDKHDFFGNIRFKSQVISVEELKKDDELFISATKNNKFSAKLTKWEKMWQVKVKDLVKNSEIIFVSPYVSVCTGHHSSPKLVQFPGQSSFPGEIIHSVKFKSAQINNFVGKRVLIVGIGNSSVDAAVNLVNEGRCSNVTISTRSGAWVVPNYISGYPSDLLPSRTSLSLPWRVQTILAEGIAKFIFGPPQQYNLNPKRNLLQAHPTISATLIHHIQRKQISIKPDIKEVSGSKVIFENGESGEFDVILLSTGYNINLDFIDPNLRNQFLPNQNQLNLYKLIFDPKIGPSLSFLGFLQPHTGGILPLSEIQARLIVYTMLGKVNYPPEALMYEDMDKKRKEMLDRFYKSERHTLQVDPIIYNDEISDLFGAKPEYFKNISVAWRLMYSSCGPAQWRINGPDAMSNASALIKEVPVPTINSSLFYLHLLLLMLLFLLCWTKPFFMVPLLALVFVAFFSFKHFRNKNKKTNTSRKNQ